MDSDEPNATSCRLCPEQSASSRPENLAINQFQDELHQFATVTQKRLDIIKLSLANYQMQKSTSVAHASPLGEPESVLSAPTISSVTNTTSEILPSQTREKDSQQLDPLARLDAIKRKLAQKIEDTSPQHRSVKP